MVSSLGLHVTVSGGINLEMRLRMSGVEKICGGICRMYRCRSL